MEESLKELPQEPRKELLEESRIIFLEKPQQQFLKESRGGFLGELQKKLLENKQTFKRARTPKGARGQIQEESLLVEFPGENFKEIPERIL